MSDVLKLYDAEGQLRAVQISPELWHRVKNVLDADSDGGQEQTPSHDLAAFEEFLAAWTFPYSYEPKVQCCCGAATDNWRIGDNFLLKNANIGGLLVFHCNHCKRTVRQKFFKDHVACEFTPGVSFGPGGAK